MYARLIRVENLAAFRGEARPADPDPRFAVTFAVRGGEREVYLVHSPTQLFHGAYQISDWYKLTRLRSGRGWRIGVQQQGHGL